MSHARDLPLLEKWSDASATNPSLSPTSPKATNFCCCPQRRRYDLKRPRKLRRHFFDDHQHEHDFNYILDDGPKEAPVQLHYVSHTTSNDNNLRCTHTASDRIAKTAVGAVDVAVDAAALQSLMSESENWKQPNEALANTNIETKSTANTRSEQLAGTTTTAVARREQWKPLEQQHIKCCCHSNSSQLSVSTKHERNTNSCSCQQKQGATSTRRQQKQQRQQESEDVVDAVTEIIEKNSSLLNEHESGVSGSVANSQTTNEYRSEEQQANQIQRLSNNIYNKENKVSSNKQQQSPQLDKMTVAATTSRQENESGSMRAATATDVATTATTSTATEAAAAATPSVTVIKTTMIKRSPNDSTKATTTAAAKATTTITTTTHRIQNSIQKENLRHQQQTNSKNNLHSNSNESSATPTAASRPLTAEEPTKSVKERIAAFAAGNDQMRNHDNKINNKKVLRRIPCNITATLAKALESTAAPTTIIPTTGSLKIHNDDNNSINNQRQGAASPSSTTSSSSLSSASSSAALGSSATSAPSEPAVVSGSASSSPTPSKINGDHLFNSSVNDASSTDATNASDPSVAIETGDCNSNRSVASSAGSTDSFRCPPCTAGSTGAATMPRRRSPTLNDGFSKSANNSATNDSEHSSRSTQAQQKKDHSAIIRGPPKPLAALENLDLALNLDLNDDDGEDPYFALQEYLERVKHEINEVFELHKARQRNEQKQQQSHEHQQRADELTRSTESDSGFDSACGQQSNGNGNHKQRTTHEKVTTTGAFNSQSNSNGHATPTEPTAADEVAAGQAGAQASNRADRMSDSNNITSSSSPTLHQLHQQLQAKGDAAAAEVAVADGCSAAAAADEVNIWAKKFLLDLDNLMGSDKIAFGSTLPSPTSTVASLLLSTAATAAINGRSSGKHHEQKQQQQRDRETTQNNPNNLVLRPMKHTTIPLQSFNLDGGGFGDGSNTANNNSNNVSRSNATSVVYLRTLSAPTPAQTQQQQQQQQQSFGDNRASMAYGNTGSNRTLATFNAEQQQQQQHNNYSNQSSNRQQQQQRFSPLNAEPMTILKIEEAAAAASEVTPPEERAAAGGEAQSRYKATSAFANVAEDEELRRRRQRQLEDDIETIRNDLINRQQQLDVAETRNNKNNSSSNSFNHTSSASKNTLVASAGPTFIPKRDRINQVEKTATNVGSSLNISPSFTLMTPSKTYAGSVTTATATATTTPTTSFLLNGSDATKKGSTSTIWTSEESILRSVGAVDEDNNSTSSSACEEASGILSSGKSGISLDSSGLDNDNNESGIGTATPPKDLSYWKNAHHHHHQHQHDNESVSSLDALRKMKFQKTSSVASSDDPDLLEVLSLCDEPQGDEDGGDEALNANASEQHHPDSNQPQRQQYECRKGDGNKQTSDLLQQDDDDVIGDDVDDEEIDEGHDEFETVTYCDCECGDGDDGSSSTGGATSAGADGGGGLGSDPVSSGNHTDTNGVVLRRKFNAAPPIMVPYGRAQKCRSHSLDTASLPTSYQLHQHQLHHHHAHHHHHHHHHHHSSQLARKLHQHLQTSRNKDRVQLSLALRQEPFQSLLSPSHFHELPSPSSASLHSGHESLGIQELTTKSNSAPLLLKQERKCDDFAAQNLTLRYSRSQSDRYLAEIEAVEACKWLRAAGFPQYAQMYEDHQFPIDLTNVAKDHTNLENDQLQSLYRRLCILNRCANMRLDQSHKTQTPQKEDSDDENFALSENWTFQPHIRRWSRIGEMGLELPPAGKLTVDKTESSSKESSPDRFEEDTYNVTGAGLTLTLPVAGRGGDSTDTTFNDSGDSSAVRLRRTGSERLKDGAKALLRRVESIKSRRRKRQNREGIVISGPHALDLSQLGQRSSMRKPDATYSTPPSPSAVSPMHIFPKSPFFGNELKVPSHSENFLSPNRASPKRLPATPRSMHASPLHFFASPMPHLREGKSDDSSSYFSDSQESSAGGKLTPSLRKTPSKTRRFLQRTGKVDDIGAHSDSECHHGRKLLIKDANSNTPDVKVKKLTRGGSLNLGKDQKKRDGKGSSSFRSRSTTRKDLKTTDDAEHVKRTPVVRWHSFQMEERPHMIFRKCFSQKIDPNSIDQGFPFAAMSAGQLQIIRKLALVILTGYMERHCPTHRSGWNWELPKFIKKIKMPDYKDKKVFGVPPILVLQRTGQTLPVAVRSAFRWLQLNALDQIGLFRKSGVKSRIIKLKELIEYSESPTECMDVFDAQQAYDVADMLKQYFRDLPESLLTTKMSETFATIFQHLPKDVRLDAVQCAVLLLPDENREILFSLLEFLTLVADNAQHNQMTANNLAVCLAPSLFHNSISTGSASVAASPRRRGKGAGVPDAKELSEAKASHECLAFLIENYRKIYTATKDKVNKCNFGYMEESKPVPLEALGEGMQFHNWRGYLYECTSATIKEGREKTRGWFSITSVSDPAVDIAYKKVGDGHPLRLWRCITEVEGPPKDVLDYIVRQRASWDLNLLQSQTLKKLDERTEIFYYAVDGQLTTDFCVLRSWQTDLPRGACVIVETSIEHSKAKAACGSVRGVVLASRYLIEPCGSGRSRVMHLARVDIKGKTPEWYNKSYGHICSHHLSRIRHAFKNVADVPESKV